VPGKLGSRDLRAQLSRLPPFIEGLPILEGNACRILICDPTGKDLSVGVALAILCLYADENGRMSNQPTRGRIDKLYIKQRLTWITTTSPVLNPSRETLKAVNSFLMPDPSSTSKAPLAQEGTKLVLVNEDGTPVTALAPLESTESAKDLPASLSEQASPSGNPTPQSVPIATTLFRKLPTSPTKPWTFKRKLTSKRASHPSGTVTGTATFTSLEQGRETLLYAEEGEFITDTGLKFTARRKYVYRLTTLPADSVTEDSENNTHISVYFHSDESNGLDPTAKDLFVEMGPLSPVEGGKVWEAGNKDQHLCGEDLYTASWRFGGRMVESKKVDEGEDLWWEVRYDVKGPRKDYVSETRYTMV
jgi:tRNA A64-2'-O-ribosylphosphate transferase